MKNVAITLGIVVLVLGFMASILSQFPAQGAGPATPVTVASSISASNFNRDAADEVGKKFSSAYTSVVDDLLTYINNPDLKRAEEHRDAMVQYAKVLIPSFQDLSGKLQGHLNDVQAQAAQEEASIP